MEGHVSTYPFTKSLARLEKNRYRLGSGVQFTVFEHINTLIIKVPDLPHEKAHLSFERTIIRRVILMHLRDIEFAGIGATLYKESRSAKEVDLLWTNHAFRPQKGLIEAGLSQSLSQPRVDARSWLGYSQMAVCMQPAESNH